MNPQADRSTGQQGGALSRRGGGMPSRFGTRGNPFDMLKLSLEGAQLSLQGERQSSREESQQGGSWMKRLLLNSICLLALAVAVPDALATTVQGLTKEELVTQADLIVVGRQIESRSVWVGRMLMTRVTVAVGETLKGKAQSTVTVDMPGGIDMNRKIPIGMSVPGAPSILKGERVVLFLSRQAGIAAHAGGGELAIVGLSQGKFTVVQEQDGSEAVVRGAGRSAKKPLAEFKAEIQTHISEQSLRGRSRTRDLRAIEED